MRPFEYTQYWRFVPGIGLFSIGLGICSCTTQIPNVQVCADKGYLGAKCAYTRNGPESQKKKIEWDKTRVGWFCMPSKAFGEYQSFIQDVCAKQQNCVDKINGFVSNLKDKK